MNPIKSTTNSINNGSLPVSRQENAKEQKVKKVADQSNTVARSALRVVKAVYTVTMVTVSIVLIESAVTAGGNLAIRGLYAVGAAASAWRGFVAAGSKEKSSNKKQHHLDDDNVQIEEYESTSSTSTDSLSDLSMDDYFSGFDEN